MRKRRTRDEMAKDLTIEQIIEVTYVKAIKAFYVTVWKTGERELFNNYEETKNYVENAVKRKEHNGIPVA